MEREAVVVAVVAHLGDEGASYQEVHREVEVALGAASEAVLEVHQEVGAASAGAHLVAEVVALVDEAEAVGSKMCRIKSKRDQVYLCIYEAFREIPTGSEKWDVVSL